MNAGGIAAGTLRRGLWSHVIRLLRLQWVIFVTGFKRARLRRKIGTVLLVVLGLGAFTGSFLLTRFLVGLMRSPEMADSGVDLASMAANIPVLIVSGVFLGILITSFGLLLQALYLSNDMDFLLSAPIPIRAVFLTKLLQAVLPNFVLILLAGLPVLFGLGVAAGYTPLYYPLVLIVLALLALAAAGISSLLVMAIVRVLPARQVAEVLAFVGAILAIVFSQWSNLSGTDSGSITAEQISSGTRTLSALNTAWSPLAWGGRGLVELGEGHWLTGLFFLILTLALSGSVFWFALGTAERLYYSGWASMQVGGRRKAVRVRTKEAASPQRVGLRSVIQRLVPPEVRAIVFKDSLQLRRDLRNLSQLVTPLIMGIVFSVMLLRGGGKVPAGRGEAPEAFMEALRIMIAYGSMAISLFVGWSLLSRLALIAFSMESRSYWMIKTSPVSLGRLLAAKFLVAYLPALGVGWLFLLAIAVLQKVPVATVIYGLPAIALILAGLDGINLALGIRGADFTWTDPRRMAGGGIGCISMLASMAYLVMASLLFFAPAVAAPLLHLPEILGQVVGLLLGGAAALLCAALPLASLKGRLQRLGED